MGADCAIAAVRLRVATAFDAGMIAFASVRCGWGDAERYVTGWIAFASTLACWIGAAVPSEKAMKRGARAIWNAEPARARLSAATAARA